MRLGLAIVLAFATLACIAQQDGSPGTKRVYVEERVKSTSGAFVHCDDYGNCYGNNSNRSRNVSLEVTREMMKDCPAAITVTNNRESADYVLRIEPGASTLYKHNGDAAYISPARWRPSSLAKDVCNFVGTQK
jgi:hypothetical protein